MKVHNYATAADENARLDAKLRYAEEERDVITKRMIALEQDLSAALADLKKADTECGFCVHSITPLPAMRQIVIAAFAPKIAYARPAGTTATGNGGGGW